VSIQYANDGVRITVAGDVLDKCDEGATQEKALPPCTTKHAERREMKFRDLRNGVGLLGSERPPKS
jgi:hypothetical protein